MPLNLTQKSATSPPLQTRPGSATATGFSLWTQAKTASTYLSLATANRDVACHGGPRAHARSAPSRSPTFLAPPFAPRSASRRPLTAHRKEPPAGVHFMEGGGAIKLKLAVLAAQAFSTRWQRGHANRGLFSHGAHRGGISNQQGRAGPDWTSEDSQLLFAAVH